MKTPYGTVPKSPTQPRLRFPTYVQRGRCSPIVPPSVQSPVKTSELRPLAYPQRPTTAPPGVFVRRAMCGMGKTACRDWSVPVTMAASRTRRGRSTTRSVMNGKGGGTGEGR